jgi:hypothetical protein
MYRSANSYKGSIDGSINCENIKIDVPLRNSSKIYITHKRGVDDGDVRVRVRVFSLPSPSTFVVIQLV